MSIIAKYEDLTLLNKDSGNNETWSYISIYNEKGELLSRSDCNHFEGVIYHKYDDLVYVASRSLGVLVTFDSLKSKFSKNE